MSCLTRVHSQSYKQCWLAQYFWTNITDEVFFHTSKVSALSKLWFFVLSACDPKRYPKSDQNLFFLTPLSFFFLCDLRSVWVPASKLLNTLFCNLHSWRNFRGQKFFLKILMPTNIWSVKITFKIWKNVKEILMPTKYLLT